MNETDPLPILKFLRGLCRSLQKESFLSCHEPEHSIFHLQEVSKRLKSKGKSATLIFNYKDVIMKFMILRSVDLLFWVYMIMLFVRILGSWFPEFQRTKFMLFIAFYTDPYLNVFRRIIPPLGFLDISPIIAFFCLSILETMVKTLVVLIVP